MPEKEIKNSITNDYDFENSIVQVEDTSNKTKYIHQKGDICKESRFNDDGTFEAFSLQPLL